MGVAPCPDLGWGSPPLISRMGYPPHPDLGWGSPSPPGKCEQTENITFPPPSDAGGKYVKKQLFLILLNIFWSNFSRLSPDWTKIPWHYDKILKFPDFSLIRKTSLDFPGFPVQVGTLTTESFFFPYEIRTALSTKGKGNEIPAGFPCKESTNYKFCNTKPFCNHLNLCRCATVSSSNLSSMDINVEISLSVK